MKKSLLDHYKMRYNTGGKVPVRKTGMWYQEGDVVVPSNQITMEGPKGQPDYFKEPILGKGIPSGNLVLMKPGGKYYFPGDKAVFETKKYQTGKKVKNPSTGFSWYSNKPTSLVSPTKSQVVASQSQQRNTTTVARPVNNATQLQQQQNAQTVKNVEELRKSIREIYKEDFEAEEAAKKAAMQPTTEDIVIKSNQAREKIFSGDVSFDNISDWFAAAPEKLKLSSPYSVLTPGLSGKIPKGIKPVTDFLDNYVNPISFGGSFWSNATQSASEFSKGKGEEGIKSSLRAAFVPAGMLLGQKLAPGLHSIEKSIGQGIQKRVGNIGVTAALNTGPLANALVTGLGRAAIGAGKAGTKAGIQAGEKVGVHTVSLPPREYQIGGMSIPGVNGTVVASVSNSSKGKTKKYQAAGSVTNNPIAEEIMQRFRVQNPMTQGNFNYPSFIDLSQASSIAKDINRYKDKKNLTDGLSEEELAAVATGRSDVSQSVLDKAKLTNLSLNFNRSGKIGNIDISGRGTAGEITKGQFNPLDINAGLNLGALGSIDYSGQVNKGQKLKSALKKENLTYRNTFGNETLGGNLVYIPNTSLTAGLNAGKDLKLNYSSTKGEDGRYVDVGGLFNPGIVSLGFNQSYGPDKKITKQSVKGSIGNEKRKLSGYRTVDEKGKTYEGKYAKTEGDITYDVSANYGNDGLQNIGGNLTASDLFNLSYLRQREGEGFTNTIGAELMPGQPLSVNFSRAYDNQGMDKTTVGGNLDLGKTQASLSKTFSKGQPSIMEGKLNTKLGKNVDLSASTNFVGNKLNKYGLTAGVNVFPGFSVSAGLEKEIGTGKPKVTVKPTLNANLIKLASKKKKTFTPLPKQQQESQDGTEVFKKGGQHGGLDRWFAEKWVDVKSGKACGRQEGENRAYPACRPSKRISSKTPKTSSELSSKEKARFKSAKTSSQRIPYNHKRK